MPEQDLIERLQRSDEKSGEEFVRTHAGTLLRVARRYLPEDADAQDAVQECFACAFASISTFRGDSGLGTWLHRILINICLKQLRTRKRRREEGLDAWLPVFDSADCRIESLRSVEPADVLLERREVRARVRDAILQLPESYRLVVMLRDLEEYSTREAAETLQISEGALKVRLHRARAALKIMLEPLLEGEK